ncbi:DUF1269 domain-containing protein [Paraburkholderia sp. CNPSo 3281]|uniref:DUF1269 domain-containing protein n=1 Tax=Paraburkholderia sp. CNPSo 3281 TaxID=2940933 RepID=UPI0020B8E70A|nr:DUF1269 domain-containing protein [Paraburkholderia sp. CNPSo 3281]MCP3717808.1 DUF1269 domain-containing protein [Paraburkholderia sp. CNPSo 3281]
MRRVYFLLPTPQRARAVVGELLMHRVEWRHMHVIANENVSIDGLPQASLAQRSDLLASLARGTAAGCTAGLLMALVALFCPSEDVRIAGGTVVILTLSGAGFGAGVAAMIGVEMPNTRLKRFEEAILRGELLMMIDVPKERVEEIEQMIELHCAQAHSEGTGKTIPLFR